MLILYHCNQVIIKHKAVEYKFLKDPKETKNLFQEIRVVVACEQDSWTDQTSAKCQT